MPASVEQPLLYCSRKKRRAAEPRYEGTIHQNANPVAHVADTAWVGKESLHAAFPMWTQAQYG